MVSQAMRNQQKELHRKRQTSGRKPQAIGDTMPTLESLRVSLLRGIERRRKNGIVLETSESDEQLAEPVTLDTLDLSWHPLVKTAVNAAREWRKLRSNQLKENKRQHEAGEEVTVKPHASLVLLATGKDAVKCTGYGCGKTHIAKAVLWSEAFVLDGKPFAPSGNFYEAARLIANLDGETQPSAEISGPILVIDDVGTEGTIPFVGVAAQDNERHARYFKAINYCYDAGISVVITANLKASELAAHIGGRAWSRLLQMAPSGLIVDLTGVPDYRRRQGGR